MKKLLEEVHSLSPGTIILLLSFNRDSTGRVFDYDETVDLASPAADVPIYGVWDVYLNRGIVGGMLTSGFDQGRIGFSELINDGEQARKIGTRKIVMKPYVMSEIAKIIRQVFDSDGL